MTAPTFTELDVAGETDFFATTWAGGASISPTANRIVIATAVARDNGGGMTSLVPSGGGITTWNIIDFVSEPSRFLSSYWGQQALPGSGVITWTADVEMRSISHHVAQGDGNEATSSPVGVIAVSQKAAALADGGTLTLDFTGFTSGNSVYIPCGGDDDVTSIAFGTDTYTELEDGDQSAQTHLAAAYLAANPTSNETVLTFTNGADARAFASGLEVKAAVAGGTNPKGPFGHPFHGPFGGPIG